jgi:flagellar basal body-associated protein FliL
MGASLEVAKLVCASWLKANWERAPRFIKYYMIIAVVVLMLITSMGIFGFLSKAHNDQNLVSGDVTSKIAIYDEKIKTAKDNIDANRKALKQMDEAVDQVMGRSSDEKGAEKAVAIRRGQQKERARLQSEITSEQKAIASLSEERAPIAAEVRKVEAEVGPIKYIAKFLYGEHGADENMLEQAVTWIIILIVVVFDPLAVIMLLAAQMSFGWTKKQDDRVDEQAEILVEDPETALHIDESPTEEPVELVQELIEPTIEEEAPNELEKWNKMIEEAEKAVAQPDSTVEERVAKGETYIDNEGKEITLEADLPETE